MTRFGLTDLEIYYGKLSNAFNIASTRDINQKFPTSVEGFAPQRPEFEIVGAFASDPLSILSTIISGDGATPGNVVTVQTTTPHGLSSGTPIKMKGVSEPDYNVSTKVASVLTTTTIHISFTICKTKFTSNPHISCICNNYHRN